MSIIKVDYGTISGGGVTEPTIIAVNAYHAYENAYNKYADRDDGEVHDTYINTLGEQQQTTYIYSYWIESKTSFLPVVFIQYTGL